MKKLLVDAGPLIALFDKNDHYHEQAITHFKSLREIPVTTWPVLTEVSHMLDFHSDAQAGFLEWVQLGGLEVFPLNGYDIPRVYELVTTYKNVPMDLADASLVVVSEHLNTLRILSIDSDFYIFRNRFKDMLVNEFKTS